MCHKQERTTEAKMANTISIEWANDGMQVHKFECAAIRKGSDVDHGDWTSKAAVVQDFLPDLEGEDLEAEISDTKWHNCTKGLPRH